VPEKRPLLPGATVGIIGGGQLGRMTAIAARQMGYRVLTLDPDPDCPASRVSDRVIVAPLADRAAAVQFAAASDVVTYEFENIDAAAVDAAEGVREVCPSAAALRTCQDRRNEKSAAAAAGLETARWRPVSSTSDLAAGVAAIGLPAVLKTATAGYDGKGQAVVRSVEEAEAAFRSVGNGAKPLVLEGFVQFEKELSVICARDRAGNKRSFPPAENLHRNGILDVSIAPARVSDAVSEEARRVAETLADSVGVVGLLCVEMFMEKGGRLLVNELAPRPHNSGHWTIEGCNTSQFQQLVRVLCGLPMGSVGVRQPSVMVNLLGDLWLEAGGRPDFAAALAVPGVALHLYEKAEARPGRKMGHITATAHDLEAALERALDARSRLTGS
jgi:5-(carboxyamino)imidazole ribonucleotide synthase